jgi:uncharacterized protein YggE
MSMSRPVLIAAAALAAALAVPSAAGAQQTPEPGERYISVNGTATAPVKAPRRETDATIGAAVQAASLAALPPAIEAARQRAAVVAQAAGLTLGAIESVSEFPYGPFGLEVGRFGPGRYCGNVTRRVTRRTASGRRVRRRTTVRECVVPPQVTQIVTVTFAVQ